MTNAEEKVLDYKTDIKIESRLEETEYFLWNCPKCGSDNRTNEWNVKDSTLFCTSCWKETKYK